MSFQTTCVKSFIKISLQRFTSLKLLLFFLKDMIQTKYSRWHVIAYGRDCGHYWYIFHPGIMASSYSGWKERREKKATTSKSAPYSYFWCGHVTVNEFKTSLFIHFCVSCTKVCPDRNKRVLFISHHQYFKVAQNFHFNQRYRFVFKPHLLRAIIIVAFCVWKIIIHF